jgi:hypothetical protein
MNAEDAQKTFDELVAILRDSGLQWVVDGVNRQVTAGKTIRKMVRVTTEQAEIDWELTTVRQRKVPQRFLGSEPYSQNEQLAMLLDAVQHVVVASAEMSEAVFAQTKAQGLEFVEEREEAKPLRVSTKDVSAAAESAGRLRSAVEELLRETHRD